MNKYSRQIFVYLFTLISPCLFASAAYAQLKVAQYTCGKQGTIQFEELEFWTKKGKPSEIIYKYGKETRDLRLQYLGKSKNYGDSCFKVQFPNKFTLYVIASGLSLKVIDSSGNYNKVFLWHYEGPVNGIGTHCDVCAEDDRDAMRILRLAYMK